MKSATEAQQQLQNIRAQYRNTTETRKIGKWGKIILAIVAIWIVVTVMSAIADIPKEGASGIFTAIFMIFVCAIVGAVAFWGIRFYNSMRNKKIEADNVQIMNANNAIQVQEQNAIQVYNAAYEQYQAKAVGVLPEKYLNLNAISAIYDMIEGQRADTIKEAINVYETTMHQQRMEQGQKEQLKQQKVNNMLAAGNLFMPGMQLQEQSRQTDAIYQNNKEIRNVYNKLNGTDGW